MQEAHLNSRAECGGSPLGRVTDWFRSSSKKGCVKACSAEYLRTGEYWSSLDTCMARNFYLWTLAYKCI